MFKFNNKTEFVPCELNAEIFKKKSDSDVVRAFQVEVGGGWEIGAHTWCKGKRLPVADSEAWRAL